MIIAILFTAACKDADNVSIEMTSYHGQISDFDNSANTVLAKVVITEKYEVFSIEIPFENKACAFYTIVLNNRTFSSAAHPDYEVQGEVSTDYSYIDITVTRKSDNESTTARLDEVINP